MILFHLKPTNTNHMIKILHTSDLHIGKRLYQEELADELQLFFGWLTAYIKEHQVNALLVAGDVFDVANPSSESRRLYYGLLRELMHLKCKVIITGGNHDSPAVLEAPRELLRHLDIHVLGGYDPDPGRLLIPLASHQGQPEAVVACLPYLRDADLRKYTPNETYEERTEAVREGIAGIYQNVADQCSNLYPGLPALATGHLYVQGATLSDSERDIQIGNLAGLDSTRLPAYFSYYALGHLHKPQQPDGSRLVYSGSPVKLSFSESANQNRVMLVTIDQGEVNTESIPVPEFRRLIRLKGSLARLKQELGSYTPNGNQLGDFIELEAREENHDPARIVELEEMIGNFRNDRARILKYGIKFANQPAGTASLYGDTESITDLRPMDVFEKRMERENLEEATRDMLREAFRELLEEVEQQTMEE